jgi:argininosuccinate lyase
MTTPTPKPWEHTKSGQGSAADPLAARFVSSLDYDKRLYTHDIRGSIAHARMLEHVKLITADDLKEIERGLNEIEAEIAEQGDAWPGWKVELEDVHMCIEAALIEKTGDAGRKLHTGRSRNDQVALDIRLWLDEASEIVSDKTGDLVESLVSLAEKQGEVVMPSYTHLQRAQPIVAGSELMAWAVALDRTIDTIALRDNMVSPLGSGAIAGSALPLDTMYTTTHLQKKFIADGEEIHYGMIEPEENSIYATASRDTALNFVFTLSMMSMWLSRWAEQWIIYSTTEFGFITLDDLYTTGSSMMPQKQNPDMLELIRGKTGQVYGSLMALLTMCKGITVGYNRDLQEDKRHVFAAYDSVCDCLDMAARIVKTTTFNEEKIKQGLDKGFLDATSLAEYLVTKGVPFRTSHQVVGKLVQSCRDKGYEKLSLLSLDDFNAACGDTPVVEQDVFDWLGPENVVKRYQSAGNAGLSGFQEQLKAWKERLGDADESE